MPRKIVAIVTFIALLEMTRLRRIKIMQSSLFEELRVYRGENFDSTAAEIEETENALISETVGQ
jgi:chromatin segregation and condensation protein Rec8/ScpA/Scc1 (kleisin family)